MRRRQRLSVKPRLVVYLAEGVCVTSKRLGPSISDAAVSARHAAMDLVRQYPQLWSQLNSLTLTSPIDWPEVRRVLEIRKPPAANQGSEVGEPPALAKAQPSGVTSQRPAA
jgi:hypothetical protein